MDTHFKPIREWTLYSYDHHFREDFHKKLQKKYEDLSEHERCHIRWIYSNILNLAELLVYDNTVDRQKELLVIFNNALNVQRDHIKLHGYENKKKFEEFANEIIDFYITEHKNEYVKIEGMFNSGSNIIELKKQISDLRAENNELKSLVYNMFDEIIELKKQFKINKEHSVQKDTQPEQEKCIKNEEVNEIKTESVYVKDLFSFDAVYDSISNFSEQINISSNDKNISREDILNATMKRNIVKEGVKGFKQNYTKIKEDIKQKEIIDGWRN